MRIALTHNLRVSDAEDEAEFYHPANIADLVAALNNNGHVVLTVDVGLPVTSWLRHLEDFAPELVFNCAEGRAGRAREALFPALFEAMGLPFTGSDAHTMMLTLDKRLTKEALAPFDVPMARHALVTPEIREPAGLSSLRFPVIAKPNFEGSSKGITEDSVAVDAAQLQGVLGRLLACYPAGVLVEEYIPGSDFAVAFLAGAPDGGILAPFAYEVDPAHRGRYNLYDYHLKNDGSDHVSVRCPAALPDGVEAQVRAVARRVFGALHVRDVGRIDFRLGDDGVARFLEINPLPWLTRDAGLFLAARGLDLSFDDVIGRIAASAARRFGLR